MSVSHNPLLCLRDFVVQLIIVNALLFALHPLVPERAVGRAVVIWYWCSYFFFFLSLRQGLIMQPWLASDSQ